MFRTPHRSGTATAVALVLFASAAAASAGTVYRVVAARAEYRHYPSTSAGAGWVVQHGVAPYRLPRFETRQTFVLVEDRDGYRTPLTNGVATITSGTHVFQSERKLALGLAARQLLVARGLTGPIIVELPRLP